MPRPLVTSAQVGRGQREEGRGLLFSQWQVNADRGWMAAPDSRRSHRDFEGNGSIPNGEEVRNARDTGVQTDAKVQG